MDEAANVKSDAFRRRYEGTTASLNGAREDVLTWLRAVAAEVSVHHRVELIVSELTTNAVQASPGRSYEVRGANIDGVIEVAVTNEDPATGIPERHRWGPDDVLATRGRGLAIVEALADEIQTTEGPKQTVTVTARITTET